VEQRGTEAAANGGAMELDGLHVAVLAGEGVEDLEYWVTVMRLREAGARVTSAGLAPATVRGKNGLAVPVEVEVGGLDPDDYDGLVIPGGWMPDKLRRSRAVTDFVAAIHGARKPIGIICHGGLIAISAHIVDGGRATGSLGIRDDLVNAGATWVDEPAFRDGNLVWGRVVEDIPAFCRELVAALAEHRASK
jgi:protease I